MERDVVEIPAGVRPRGFTAERKVIAASAALYAASLILPAIAETYPGGMRIDEQGYLILAMGWMGILIGQVGWFANPVWLLAVVLLWRRRWTGAARASGAAVLLGAVSFALYSTGIPSDSGDTIKAGLLIGFWVWWSSLWVLAAGAVTLRRRARPTEVASRGDAWRTESPSGSRNPSS